MLFLGTFALLPACSRDWLVSTTSDGSGTDIALRADAAALLPDAASACTFPPPDDFTIRVHELDGFADAQCWDSIRGYGSSISVDVIGVVTSMVPAEGRFVVDTCPAWVQCKKPRRVEVTLTWPGKSTEMVMPGAFVHLRADVATFERYCTATLEVQSVASIGARTNRDGFPDGMLYAAAQKGGTTLYPGSPLTVSREPTGCYREASQHDICFGPPDIQDELQRLGFTIDGATSSVPMGQAAPIWGTPGARSAYGLSAFNLMSYTKHCQDERGFRWLVLPQLHPGG